MKRLALLSLIVGAGVASPFIGTPITLAVGSELVIPVMNAASGRKLFASKGCVVCHSVNGIGGKDARALDAATMPEQMNPFDFAAKMWQGAPVMVLLQRKELGEQTQLTGQELADIIAFVHSSNEQQKFSEDDIPPKIKELLKE